MIGRNHLLFIVHCLRAKAARDSKTNATYRSDALRRLRMNIECQRVCQLILDDPAVEAVEIALALGWEPPVSTREPLKLLACEWLDSRQ